MSETNRLAEASRNHTEEESSGISSMLPAMPESCQKAGEAVKQYVEENPVAASAITFGAGLGLGILATVMLRSSTTPTTSSMASRLGQMMLDKAGNFLPDTLVDRFNG